MKQINQSKEFEESYQIFVGSCFLMLSVVFVQIEGDKVHSGPLSQNKPRCVKTRRLIKELDCFDYQPVFTVEGDEQLFMSNQ